MLPKNILAVDTETTGLSHRIHNLQLITTYNGKQTRLLRADDKQDMERAAKLLSSKTPKVFHNAKFDLPFLRDQGLEVNGKVYDTLIMAHVLGEHQCGLKKLAKKHLSGDADVYEKELKKALTEVGGRWDLVDRGILEVYAIHDAIYTYDLYQLFKERIRENELIAILEFEHQFIEMTTEIEDVGIRINKAVLGKMRKEFLYRRSLALEKLEVITRQHGYTDFNYNSNQQIIALLKEMDVELYKHTKTGQCRMDEAVLKSIRNNEFTKQLLAYRKAKKLSDFCIQIADSVESDGRIHPSFWSIGAVTGRQACSSPNLQQMPLAASPDFRKIFISEKDKVFLFFDYEQIEMKLCAMFANDLEVLAAINDGLDLHNVTACKLFDCEIPTPEQRLIAKTINFGILYGMGADKLHDKLTEKELDISFPQAKKFLADYYKAYPMIRRLRNSLTTELVQRRYIESLMGRRLFLPLNESYKAINYIIQSSAADIFKFGLFNVWELLKAGGYEAKIILPLHDEIIIEVPPKEVKELVPKIKALLTVDNLPVIYSVDVKISKTNWYAKKVL